MPDDKTLAELKKQTMLLADRQAARAGAGVLVVSGIALPFIADLPAWAYIAGPVALGLLAYRMELHKFTKN